jgi:hypothetical protein
VKNFIECRDRFVSYDVAVFSFRSTDPVLSGVCAEDRVARIILAA